jgi:hypothetical protein
VAANIFSDESPESDSDDTETIEDDDSLLTPEEVNTIVAFMRSKRTSVRKFLRTIMWQPQTHYGCNRALSLLLKDKSNPYLSTSMICEILESRDWEPVSHRFRKELKNFGSEVVGRFSMGLPKRPEINDIAVGQSTEGGTEEQGRGEVSQESAVRLNRRSERRSRSSLEALIEIPRSDVLQQYAPTLSKVLARTTRPLKNYPGARKNPAWPALGMNMSQLAYIMAPTKHNGFAASLGAFLHHANLTRRGLETLNRMGVVVSYSTVNKIIKAIADEHAGEVQTFGESLQRAIAYDNFNVTDGVRELRAGDEKVQHNITTGLIKICKTIPPEGLKRSWFTPSYELTTDDIISPDIKVLREEIAQTAKIWSYYISNTIEACFPGVRDQIIKQTPPSRRTRGMATIMHELPNLQRPQEHSPAMDIPLGPMMFDESTNEGTVGIFNNIFEQQIKIPDDDPQWENNIFLVFGDALTTSRVHTWKADASVDSSAFGNGRWVLPIFGLWHLRYNFIQLICQEHWGGDRDDMSTLHRTWHSVYTSRKFDPKLFQVASDLVGHAFQSRILAILIRYLHQEHSHTFPETDFMPDKKEVLTWLRELKAEGLHDLISWIREQLDINAYMAKPREERDDEWLNHLHFVHNVFPYMVLTDAIKHSDIGLLRLSIKWTLVIFAAADNRWLYRRELCYYYWLTNTPAAIPRLQECILFESLINRQGKQDSYYEMDRAVELLNLYLRIIKTTRKTSSINVEKLLNRYARTANFLMKLRDVFGEAFKHGVNGYHQSKPLADHLWILASNLWERVGRCRSIEVVPGRGSVTHTRHLFAEGQLSLAATVDKFNEWRRHYNLTGDDIEGKDITEISHRQEIHRRLIEAQRAADREKVGETPTAPSEEHPASYTEGLSLSDLQEDLNNIFGMSDDFELELQDDINDEGTPASDLDGNGPLSNDDYGDNASQFSDLGISDLDMMGAAEYIEGQPIIDDEEIGLVDEAPGPVGEHLKTLEATGAYFE